MKAKTPLCGPAFWDHGQKNMEGIDLYKVTPSFYKTDLEYKLKEFKYYLSACEMQKEAHYSCKENKSWEKLNLYDIPEFKHFLLKNKFWGLHLKATDIDITSVNNKSLLEFSINEINEGIRFGFNNFCDSLVLHPGTLKKWFPPEEMKSIQIQRAETFKYSLEKIMDFYCNEIFNLIKYIDDFKHRQSQNINTLKHYFRFLRIPSLAEDEYYRISNEILKIIRIAQLPIKIVRYCQKPNRSIHLCLENIEPPNLLINSPYQHVNWFNFMSELYNKKIRQYFFDQEIIDRFRPMMLIDVNHYLHSKKIMLEPGNSKYSSLYNDFSDFKRDFVKLPPDFNSHEPLLNKIIRENRENILYYHLGGCYVYDNIMYTHESIKALRNKMFMIANPQGVPVPKYQTSQFNPSFELNLEEVLQIIGYDNIFILEVFNVASELIKSSEINVSSYLNFLAKEDKRLRSILDKKMEQMIKDLIVNMKDHTHEIDKVNLFKNRMANARLFIKYFTSNEDKWKVGYNYAGFYEESEKPEILAMIDDETGNIDIPFMRK